MHGLTFYGGRRILMAPENEMGGGGSGEGGASGEGNTPAVFDSEAEIKKLLAEREQDRAQIQTLGQSMNQIVELLSAQASNTNRAPPARQEPAEEPDMATQIRTMLDESTRPLMQAVQVSNDRADRLEFERLAEKAGLTPEEITTTETAYQALNKRGAINPFSGAPYTRTDAAATISGYKQFGARITDRQKAAEADRLRRNGNVDAGLETNSRDPNVSADPNFEKLAPEKQLAAIKANLDKHKF